MVKANERINHTINIAIHVLILFIFLTLFFFYYVSRISKRNIKKAFSDIIDKKINELLTETNKWNEKIDIVSVDWNEVNNLADDIILNSQKEIPEIVENNNRLKYISIIIIFCMILGIFILYFYYKYMKGYDIPVGYIIYENIIILSLIGTIEFLFFTKIASKYIPITHDFVYITILNRIKSKVSTFISDTN
jgi:predicted PurR-regulated permease PerM